MGRPERDTVQAAMFDVRVELTDAELLLRGGLQRRDAIDRAVVVVAVEQEHQRPALHRVVVEGQLEVPDEPLHLLCQRLVAAVVLRGEPAAPAIARVVGGRALKQQPARIALSACRRAPASCGLENGLRLYVREVDERALRRGEVLLEGVAEHLQAVMRRSAP